MKSGKPIKRLMNGGGQDKRGRRKGKERFLKLEHWFLRSRAWRALSPAAKAVYIEIAQRYNGSNNGEISLSVREAARLVHISKNTAGHIFYELEAHGFIRRNVCGSFNYKLRHATTWILTAYDLDGKPATKDFMRWYPQKLEAGPNSETNCPKRGPPEDASWPNDRKVVPRLGPWALSCRVPRSQTTAHI